MAKNILIELAENLSATANTLKTLAEISAKDETETYEEIPVPAEPEVTVTLEEVRAVLAEKARDGRREEVKALLQKYGAEKLSAVDPSNYAALKAEAEAM